MLAYLAIAAILAPPPPATIDVTLRAAPIRQALAEIGSKAQLPLSVSNDLAGEIVSIRVQNVSPQDLLGRIALVAGGRWEQNDEGFRLVLDTTQMNRDRRESSERRVARLRARLSELSKPNERLPNRGDGPGRKAILAALGAVDLRDVAALGPRGRIVYASQPNRMQRQLPGVAMPFVQQMAKEHNDRIAAAGTPDDSALSTELEQMEASMPWIRAMRERARQPIKQVGKVLLVVQASVLGLALGQEALEAELRVYHADGKVAIEEELALSDVFEQATPSEGPSTPIEPSEETKLLGSLTADLSLSQVSAELMKRLRDPVRFDPLGFSAADRLFALASKREATARRPRSGQCGRPRRHGARVRRAVRGQPGQGRDDALVGRS